MTNKEKVIALLTSLQTGDLTPLSYIHPNRYIQHNGLAGDGLTGFGELLKNKPAQGFKVRVMRAFEDGPYVFTHSEYDFFGPKIGFDIFRFEECLIVEHWDNLQPIVTQTKSGHSMIDGPTVIIDAASREKSRLLVKRFIDAIFYGGKVDTITEYISAQKYIQHNPSVADGLSGFAQALEAMAKAGIHMRYTHTHQILSEGEFVLAVSEGELGEKKVSFYDLFRLEAGRITEHWDVIEELLPEEKRLNTNGKFNFPAILK